MLAPIVLKLYRLALGFHIIESKIEKIVEVKSSSDDKLCEDVFSKFNVTMFSFVL